MLDKFEQHIHLGVVQENVLLSTRFRLFILVQIVLRWKTIAINVVQKQFDQIACHIRLVHFFHKHFGVFFECQVHDSRMRIKLQIGYKNLKKIKSRFVGKKERSKRLHKVRSMIES